jgi:hypothetical protein
MTVIRGKVWPDHEFAEDVYGYAADRNSVHNFRTPFETRETVMKQVEILKKEQNTFRLRVAHYRLVEVEEFECIGERPKEEADASSSD